MNPFLVKYCALSALLLMFALSCSHSIVGNMGRAYPNDEIIIATVYPGASAKEVEFKVTNKIEKSISTISGIKKVLSTSRENVSTIRVTLDLDNSKNAHRNLTGTMAAMSEFPIPIEKPTCFQKGVFSRPLLELAVGVDDPEIQSHLKDLFERKFAVVPGVAHINLFGALESEVFVRISTARARAYGVKIKDILDQLQKMTSIEKSKLSIKQISNLAVGPGRTGVPVRMGDLAKLQLGAAKNNTIARINGRRAIIFSIYATDTADPDQTKRSIVSVFNEEMAQQRKIHKFPISTYVSTGNRVDILFKTPAQSSLTDTAQRVSAIESILSSFPQEGIQSYFSKVGTYGRFADVQATNHASITLNITPAYSREKTAKLVEQIRSQSQTIPNIAHLRFFNDFQTNLSNIRVVGSNDSLRKKLTDDLHEHLKKLKGVMFLHRDDRDYTFHLKIELNKERLSRYGVSEQDIKDILRIARTGVVVGMANYEQQYLPLRVVLSDIRDQKPMEFMALPISTNKGHFVPLGALADFKLDSVPEKITHYGSLPAHTLSFEIDESVTSLKDVTRNIQTRFDLHKDYSGMRLIMPKPF